MIATVTTGRQELSAETNTSGAFVCPLTTRRIGNLGKQGNKDHSSSCTLVTKVADFACCFVWVWNMAAHNEGGTSAEGFWE